MDQDYKVLGQASPIATSDSDLYTVPAGTQTVVSSLMIANRSSSVATTYRIAVVPSGETLANQHYIAYDIPVNPVDSATITIGITLGAGDKIVVYASAENLSFSVFGAEFS